MPGTAPAAVAVTATAVGAVTATDPDDEGSAAFALNGGTDEAKFAITPAAEAGHLGLRPELQRHLHPARYYGRVIQGHRGTMQSTYTTIDPDPRIRAASR